MEKIQEKTVRKAVILAGGMGVRLLPLTKAMAKEVFPIFNKPAMQHIVDELAESGIEEAIIVINKSKKMIQNHFSEDKKLEAFLTERKQLQYLEEIKKVARIKVTFAFQPKALGSAHAIECAKPFLVKGEPFVIVNGDDLMFNSKVPVTKQHIDCFNKHKMNVVGGQTVAKDQVPKYGMLKGTKKEGKALFLTDIVEKPKLEDVTSTLVALGRYVVNYDYFEALKRIPPKNGERNMTYALQELSREGKVIGFDFTGTRYDLGNNLGFVTANIEYALRDKTVGPQLQEYLKKIIK